MPNTPDLSFALGLPPERAISYFNAKGYEELGKRFAKALAGKMK